MSDPCDEMSHDYELLTSELLKLAPRAGLFSFPVPGMEIVRRDTSMRMENALCRVCVSIVVQGARQVSIGTDTYEQSRGRYLLNCIDMPSLVSFAADHDTPFLSLSVGLDPGLLAQLFDELDAAGEASCDANDGEDAGGHFGPERSVRIGEVSREMLDAFLRLARSAGDAEKRRFIVPLILREIHYYLVSGPYGPFLRAFYASSSQSGQIARAASFMRDHCSERLRIEHLARMVNMAESTFNRNFKKVTTLSPLQYHKHLKLLEARRLMSAENMSASSACYAVGYESQQQFTREYKRLFGSPPMKDVRRRS